MAKFLFAPTPNLEAAAFIAGKPLVSRAIFAKLLPELKARAFVISGIEAADVLQRTREALAELPQGGDWETIKKGIYHDLCPHFVDPAADAEEQAGQRKAAERRAELLLRTHGQQAYAAAQYAMLDEQRDLFPFWQYLSLGDEHVRETHAALDGIVLPADHEFWNTHYPPWEWSCRCQIVPLTEGDTARLAERQKDKPKDQQDVLDAFAQQDLTATRRLVRNGVTYNVTAPREEGKPGAFTFHPGDLRISLDALKARYDAETWEAFEKWAGRQALTGFSTAQGGRATLLDWISGTAVNETASIPVVKAEAVARAVVRDARTADDRHRAARAAHAAPAPREKAAPRGKPAPWKPREIQTAELEAMKQALIAAGFEIEDPARPLTGEAIPHDPAAARQLAEIRRGERLALLDLYASKAIYNREHPEGNRSEDIARWSLAASRKITAEAEAKRRAI